MLSAELPANNERRPFGARRAVWTAICCATLVAAGLAAYGISLHGPFIFDDSSLFEPESAKKLWPLGPILSGPRPVAQATFALNYALGGRSPGGFHLLNLAIHILAALTLFGVVRRTLALPDLVRRFGERAATPIAFCIALLWLLHPLQTQAVTYIVQRTESLMGLFYLLTLYCVIRSTSSVSPIAWQAAAAIACALGMGSKQVMVTAPLVVLLYDRTFVAGAFGEALRRRWRLYLALAATWIILARSVLEAVGAHPVSAGFALPGVTPLRYAVSEPAVILHYLRLAFWPAGLCLDYGWPVARTASEIAPGAIVVGALLAATVWALIRRPMWGFAGAWFFLALAPTSSFLPIKDLAFEQRMYLPLAGIVAAAVLVAYQLGRRLIGRPGINLAVVFVLAIAMALGTATYLRNQDYGTEISIWKDTTDKAPRNPRAWNNLADACFRTGEYDRTIQCADEAIVLNKNYAEAYNNRGLAYAATNRLRRALDDYRKAIQLKPDFAYAYMNRANLYDSMDEYNKALADYATAIGLKPADPKIYFNRAITYSKTGEYDKWRMDIEMARSLGMEAPAPALRPSSR